MSFIETPKRKAAAAFIQASVDPDDPEYAFHSDKIVTLLGELHDDFTEQKSKLDTQWGEDETACNDKKAAINADIDSNNDAMDDLESEIATLKEEISDANEALDEADSIFKDDSLYLRDLTKKCVDTARICTSAPPCVSRRSRLLRRLPTLLKARLRTRMKQMSVLCCL